MESHLVAQVFRRLLSHQTCSRLRFHNLIPKRVPAFAPQRRHYKSSNEDNAQDDSRQTSNWQQRTDLFPPDKLKEYEKYPMVTADQLRSRRERPTRVKMLARDFMEDSLYNPNYGYFPKQVTIFSPGTPFDFPALANEPAFHHELSKRYTTFEDALDAVSPNETRQLWHTPTELFRPYYGEAIARYVVTNYRLSAQAYPYHDLTIYELGAGNGTLMLNILDYIRDLHPDVYPRTKFKIIEISTALASLQAQQLSSSASARGHAHHVEIINKSIFEWSQPVPHPCYILALEVVDNFAHDSIRYDPLTAEPLQCTILIDSQGDFYEFYSKTLDPAAARFLRVRAAACETPFAHPLQQPRWLRRLKRNLPFAGNLTLPEYVPTRLLQFFDVLRSHFPLHQLLLADFSHLPDTVAGFNAPVVQTRYQRRVVPVSTPYVQQGFFDILFPTDFGAMEDIYRAVTGKLTRVMGQGEFLERWGYLEDTRTRSGENPMISWYANSRVMVSIST